MSPAGETETVKSLNRYLLAVALGIGVAHTPGVATAAVNWMFTSGSCVAASDGSCTNDEFDRSQTYAGDIAATPDVTVSGWGNTLTSNTTLEQGWIARYSGGLGVRNNDWNRTNSDGSAQDPGEGSSPEHAVDNDDRFDFVLFDFGGTAISLNQVTLGYRYQDADISVLAYTGGGAPVLTGETYTDSAETLVSNNGGWEVIGNYDVDSIDSSKPYTAAINTANVESSYWIVGAYNSVFGDCSSCQVGGYLDYFKILGVAGEPVPDTGFEPSVPAPGTLLLLAAAGWPLLSRVRGQRSGGRQLSA